jgi:hypothetical protein
MRGQLRRLSGSSFGIGRGVISSIVRDQRRDRIRGLAGQPLKNRPERKCLGMEVWRQLVPYQRGRYARLRHRAKHIWGDCMVTAGVLQYIHIDSPPAVGFASLGGSGVWPKWRLEAYASSAWAWSWPSVRPLGSGGRAEACWSASSGARAGGCSERSCRTACGRFSKRNPTKRGWRSLPWWVHSAKAISATRARVTQWTSAPVGGSP